MISDLNTYLNKAVPDTRLTIKKYLDTKFEYLVSIELTQCGNCYLCQQQINERMTIDGSEKSNGVMRKSEGILTKNCSLLDLLENVYLKLECVMRFHASQKHETLVSDVAVFVLKRDVKLQPTNQKHETKLSQPNKLDLI